MTFKLPDIEQLGGLPGGGTRRVASYDASPVARGAEAIGAAVERGGNQLAEAVGSGGRAIGQGLEQFGKGTSNLGEGTLSEELDKERWQYASAHSQFLTSATDLLGTYGKDQNYADMSKRFAIDMEKTRDTAAANIESPAMRERFVNTVGLQMATAQEKIETHARSLESNAQIAWVENQGDKLIDQGSSSKDPNLQQQIIQTHSASIDALQARGWITPETQRTMKQTWAHRFAIAEGLVRSKTDPDGVINDLRAAPGSDDAVVNRIIHVEGTTPSSSSSAQGTGQFTDKTWVNIVKQKRPDLAEGHSDDEILSMRADGSLARDMVKANLDDNRRYLQGAGVTPTPANLYLAHFLGPKGAAAVAQADPKAAVDKVLADAVGPDMAAKMIQANPNVLLGKQAGSVQGWADGKMGGAAAGGVHLYDVLRPEQREILRDHAEKQLQSQKAGDVSTLKQRIDDTTSEAMRTGMATNPVSQAEFVGALGPQKGIEAFKAYQGALKFGADVTKVSGMNPDEQDALLKSYEPQAGPGYAEALRQHDQLQKIIGQVQQVRAKDPEFKARIDATLAENASTGNETNPIDQAEFIHRLGREQGFQAYKAYRDSVQFGLDARHLGDQGPDQQAAVLKQYEPQPGPEFIGQQKRYDALGKALDQVNKEKAADPALFAVQRLPASGDAWKAFSAKLSDPNASDDDRANAARDFANKTLLEQARVGIPESERRIVPKDYAAAFSAQITKAGDSEDPQKRISIIAQVQREKAMWGDDAWPLVASQLPATQQPIVRAIVAGSDPAALSRLLALPKGTSPAKLLADQDETKAKDITTNVISELRPFRDTLMPAQLTRDEPGWFNLTKELAALIASQDHDDAKSASAKAYKLLIGDRYEIKDTWRMPKEAGVSADDVQAGTVAARNVLTAAAGKPLQYAFGVVPFADRLGLGETANHADSLNGFARNGRFVTSPRQDGLNLYVGSAPVRRADGEPLVLGWKDLAELGKAWQNRGPFDEPPASAGGPAPGGEGPGLRQRINDLMRNGEPSSLSNWLRIATPAPGSFRESVNRRLRGEKPPGPMTDLGGSEP